MGDVCDFVRKHQYLTKVIPYVTERKGFENLCNSIWNSIILITLSLYIPPTKYFNEFISSLHDILKYLYNSKSEIIISDKINTIIPVTTTENKLPTSLPTMHFYINFVTKIKTQLLQFIIFL